MGGRLRVILTGSAPLSEEVMNFCRATMGCYVVEGYGQTECVAGATLTIEGDCEPCKSLEARINKNAADLCP